MDLDQISKDIVGNLDVKKNDFQPREYQVELLEIALKQNSILYLPTGSGKTFIATLLIKELSKAPNTFNRKFSEGGKLTFFLVNTVTLVLQQSKSIRLNTHFDVGQFYGDLGVDFWSKETWLQQFDSCQVVVMTSQIFLNLLQTNVLRLNQVNLIIFDECHHCVNNHPMRQIMQQFQYSPVQEHPRILGLTATLLNSNVKPKDVKSEISNLESTLRCKIATATNDELVKQFSTNPEEKIIPYEPNNSDGVVYKVCETMIKSLKSFIDRLIFEVDPPPDKSLIPKGSTPLKDEKKINKKLKNILADVQVNLTELGLYAGCKAVIAHQIQLNRLQLAAELELTKMTFAHLITALSTMRKLLEVSMANNSGKEKIFEFSSPKLVKLFELLLDFKESNTAIVFVQRRFTAKILYYVLKDLKAMDKRYKNIKPDFMVGFNSNPYNDTREGYLQKKWNREVMARFSKGEINVLSASDVIEEGMDVQLCNMVIKFDKPNDFRSYVQCKGRARSKKSEFLLFKCVEDKKFPGEHEMYQTLEDVLLDCLGAGQSADRSLPTEDEINTSLYQNSIEGLEPFMPQGPNGPNINCISSISIVNQYCAKLSIDRFSRVCPYWSVYTKGSKSIGHIILPMESKVRGEIIGKPMPNKWAAKQSVAIETCKRLYEEGELSLDTLLPIGHKSQVIDDPQFTPCWVEEKEVAKNSNAKRKQKYSKAWPESLSNCCPIPDTLLYIHLIQMKPVYNVPNDDRRLFFYNLLKSDHEFGILSTKKLPEVSGFPLYLNVGELEGKITSNLKTTKLTAQQVENAANFHAVTFSRVMTLVKPFMIRDRRNKENSFFVVPVITDKSGDVKIDWDTINMNQSVPDVIEPSAEEKMKLQVTDQSHLGTVVCPYYRDILPFTNYIVTKVCHDQNENTNFPSDDFDSYADYFIKKYDRTLLSTYQPLIEVRAISKRINCLKPRTVSKNRRKRINDDEDFEETLVPELCVKFNYPAVYWLKATVLPTVLHRLNQFLIAEELRVRIINDLDIGRLNLMHGENWNPLCLDRTTIKEEQQPDVESGIRQKKLKIEVEKNYGIDQEPMDLDRDIENVDLFNIINYSEYIKGKIEIKNQESLLPDNSMKSTRDKPPTLEILQATPYGHIGPQQTEIMQALTAACSNDIVHYERLETLGDCFLKFSISLSLYLTFPDFGEGELTQIKGKVVGNRNLFYCAEQIKLGSMIKVNEFSPNEDWIPPGFCVPPFIQSVILNAHLSPRVLFHINIPPAERDAGEINVNTYEEIENEIIERGDDDDWSPTNTNFISTQIIGNKTMSDAVEALIGVYLKSCGVQGALKLVQWLKIFKQEMLKENIFDKNSPNVCLGHGNVSDLLIEPDKLEDILGYKFRDRAYMLHAVSHPSYTINYLTKCYQRLEFLGDAVIDFLITCHIYEKCGNLSPGDLTDLRSALVNNITLACLSVRYGLHKFLLARSCHLDNAVNKFVRHQEENDFVVDDDVLFLMEENEVRFAECVDVPKVLGDIFESLIGAVYLDSGKDLNVTWCILYNLMKKEIDMFSKKVPKNHVRQLYEVATEVKFLPSRVLSDIGIVLLAVEVLNEGKLSSFVGFGENKKKAKRAAAKLALRSIYNL